MLANTKTSEYFAQVKRHQRVGDFIVAHSTNSSNIYEEASSLLSFHEPITLLDIGCGYGNFTKALIPKLKPGSTCHGLDCRINFIEPFTEIVKAAGLRGKFFAIEAERMNLLASHSYDLVAAAFSLYFFPHQLNEIKRILKPNGILLAITHSNQGLNEFFDDLRGVIKSIAGRENIIFDIERKVASFCEENCLEFLRPHFEIVRMNEHPNQLVFNRDDMEDLLYYLDFRLDVMSEEEFLGDDLELNILKHEFFNHIRKRLRTKGIYTLNKEDAIFIGKHPK
ncbi:MAG: class I SAM-dependent methyltransferase [Candidatus Marinimicrobia bacterium]|nr:class I SAM-dependent methyltransferase [Candidatus Neomarinimicrobiota bacterium]